MLTPDEISGIIAKLQTTFKASNGALRPKDWGSNYEFAVTVKNQIASHAELRTFPTDLMKAKAPNESTQELQYRKDIFEPITKSFWEKAMGTIRRIWAEQNYSVKWSDPEIEAYFTQDFPLWESALTYFKTVVTDNKINDPNAVLLIDIGELPTKYEEDDNGTQIPVIDDSVELSPTFKIYFSDKVLMHEVGEFVLLLTDELSPVERNGKTVNEGFVLLLVDDETIYKIYQTGKKIDWLFKCQPIYQHALGYLPAQRLRGKVNPKQQGEDIVYESWFQAAIPYLNKALKLDSTLDISINKQAYPTRVYYDEPCMNPNCKSGKVAVYDPANVDAMTDTPTPAMLKDCPDCGGTGKRSGFSPLRDYVHTPRTGFNGDNQQLPFPGLAFVAPDSQILEFADAQISQKIQLAFSFLNIDVATKPTGDKNGGQKEITATKSKIDREELFSFLLAISEQLFSLLEFGLKAAYELRYPGKEFPITIQPPVNFDLRDLNEITEELATAQSNNLPSMAQRKLLKDYFGLRFPAEKGLEKFVDAIFYCDPFAHYSPSDISLLKGQGAISNQDIVLHFHLEYFLDQAITDNPDYLDKDLKAIKDDMLKAAAAKVDELQQAMANDPNSAQNLMKNNFSNLG